jgi:hypothetical protein
MYSQGCGGSSPPFGTKDFFFLNWVEADWSQAKWPEAGSRAGRVFAANGVSL